MGYCAIAKHLLTENPIPYRKLICDIVELDEYPGVFFITLYASNLTEFNSEQIADITDWLNRVKRILNEHPLVEGQYSHLITQKEPR